MQIGEISGASFNYLKVTPTNPPRCGGGNEVRRAWPKRLHPAHLALESAMKRGARLRGPSCALAGDLDDVQWPRNGISTAPRSISRKPSQIALCRAAARSSWAGQRQQPLIYREHQRAFSLTSRDADCQGTVSWRRLPSTGLASA